jgi:prepilin-type processing-associated H-X9-DG protein
MTVGGRSVCASARESTASSAFTVLELTVILVVLLLLVALLIPVASQSKTKAARMQCVSNLKQLGGGYRTWSGEHSELWLTQPDTNQTSQTPRADSADAARRFLAMSNELKSSMILACPADAQRLPARTWAELSNSNISYFLGLDVDETDPSLLLAGDRNLTNGTPLTKGVLTLVPGRPVGWTRELHDGSGNVVLGDGSVQQFSGARLSSVAAGSGTNLCRFLIP